MNRSYSDSVKEKVLRLYNEKDKTYDEITALTGIPVGTIGRWARAAKVKVPRKKVKK